MAKKKYFLIIFAIFFSVSGCLFSYQKFVRCANAASTTFFVDPEYDLSKRSQISATLKATGQHAYFFVDDDWWGKLSSGLQSQTQQNINNLLGEFDNVIYPRLTSFLGDIWSPGIDNDPKITILALPLSEDAGGYINYSDEFPKSKIAKSNEREMVYLNASQLNSPLVKSFLAHEFQHLITFYQKNVVRGVSEDVWLNEARSEYASTYLGYDDLWSGSYLERRVKVFLENFSDPLCEFKNSPGDYAAINLFLQYLADQYGKEVISEMIKNDKVGIESINDALKKKGYNVDFSAVFTNWAIANFLNDCTVDKSFCYKNPNLNSANLRISSSQSFSLPGKAENVPIKDWQPIYYKFEKTGIDGKKILKINFEEKNPEDLFKIPYIIYNSDGTISVKFMDKATVYIPDFGDKVDSIVAIPLKESKFDNFSTSDPVSFFSISAEAVEEISQIPENNEQTLKNFEGSLLRQKGDYKVYLVEKGKKHWIPNPWIFILYDLKWENIKEVDPEILAVFPRAKLFRQKGDSKVYYLTESGLIRHIPTEEVFLSYGNQWEDILEIEEGELGAYPVNDLIKLENDYKVYKLENGKKRWIKTAQAFNRLKYDWSKIAPVNLVEFNYYPEGSPIE